MHVLTRSADGQPTVEQVEGVRYHRSTPPPADDFMWQVSQVNGHWVDALYRVEDHLGPFDVVHGHDWLSAAAMEWVTAGRPRATVFTVHSTEYGRCGNNFYEGESAGIRAIERGGLQAADRGRPPPAGSMVCPGLPGRPRWWWTAAYDEFVHCGGDGVKVLRTSRPSPMG